MIFCRTLTDADFPQLYQATLEAFSDYVVPYQPTLDALQRMFVINGVDFGFSVGAFDGEKIIGFIVNAAGDWAGRRTVYNSGTGVLSDYRKQGISRKMFEFALPVLKENKIEQCLLEVVTENAPAVNLYQNLGFEITRELSVFKKKDLDCAAEKFKENIRIKEIELPDWELFESFWTYLPSWQNSTDSIKRSLVDETIVKTFLGAYLDQTLVGYAVLFHNSGNIPQIAVAEPHRGKNIGCALLNSLQKRVEKPLFVPNVDRSAESATAFFAANRFALLTTQQEMLLKL